MKKLISLLLILFLLFPVSSLASTEDELIGTWIGVSDQSSGNMAYMYLRLFDDHTAVREVNHFSFFDSDGFSLVSTGEWELQPDGLHVYTYNYWDHKKEEFHYCLTQAHYLAFLLSGRYILFQKMVLPHSVDEIHTVSSWD